MVPEATQNLHVVKQCGWARGVLKATQSLHVARRCGWAQRCRKQHQACVSQSNVTRHGGAEGNTKLACRKAMWQGNG
ncbi:unnamed protein product [Prunus armeniaca]